MTQSVIVMERFTKHYGDRTAVEELSLQVPAGSVFGFLGQNGAGKTTTIRALLNLIRPTSGRLSVVGLDSVSDSVALRRRVGYLPEQPEYYPWMSVDEILRFNASFYPSWDRDLARPAWGACRRGSLGTCSTSPALRSPFACSESTG